MRWEEEQACRPISLQRVFILLGMAPGGGQGKYGVKVRVATFPRDMTVVS